MYHHRRSACCGRRRRGGPITSLFHLAKPLLARSNPTPQIQQAPMQFQQSPYMTSTSAPSLVPQTFGTTAAPPAYTPHARALSAASSTTSLKKSDSLEKSLDDMTIHDRDAPVSAPRYEYGAAPVPVLAPYYTAEPVPAQAHAQAQAQAPYVPAAAPPRQQFGMRRTEAPSWGQVQGYGQGQEQEYGLGRYASRFARKEEKAMAKLQRRADKYARKEERRG